MFPVKTFLINVLGCIAIGIIAVVSQKHIQIDARWILFLKVGVCGGFTTFSTFALETTDLLKSGHITIAFIYAIASVVVGCAVITAVELAALK